MVCLGSGNKKTSGKGETLKEMQVIPPGSTEDSPSVITEGQDVREGSTHITHVCVAVRSSADHRCALLCLLKE